MKVLNLTEGFDPFNKEKSINVIEFESFIFNGGEPHIKIDPNTLRGKEGDIILVTTRINNMEDLGKLMVTINALQHIGNNAKILLFIPYFPGARQDRRMIKGEPLTVKVYADIINAMKLASVTIYDPHSDVASALINNCEVFSNHSFVERCIDDIKGMRKSHSNITLISPDAGAVKKLFKFKQYIDPFDKMGFIKCDKTRDVANGNITGFEVYAKNSLKLKGKDCVIVDDICDGGGTFIGLAEELKKKGAGDLHLVVSHGIFSKGFKELKKHFKTIYTTDSWQSKFDWEQEERDNTEICEIIPFRTFL